MQQLQIQYFHAAVSENRTLDQVKFVYRVDSWLMLCLLVPYSLLVTATNKYLQTEKWRF